MYETTKAALAREFCTLARDASPNSETSFQAQDFFREHLMGLSPAERDAPRSVLGEDRARMQQACLEGMGKVLQTLTGTEFQMSVGYDTIMNMLPERETAIRHTLRKVALDCGLTEPVGWAPKRAPGL